MAGSDADAGRVRDGEAEPVDAELDVDVVVIGAGIAGSSVGWRLATAGRQVAVVEAAGTAGAHATGRSAAMLNVTSGPLEVCRLAAASRAFLADPPAGFTDHPLLGPRGLLWVGGEGADARLDALVAKAPGEARRLYDREAWELVPTLHPESVVCGGVHEPGAMTIDVAALLAGYVSGLQRAGGRLLLGREAVALDRRGDRWVVAAPPARLRAPVVVNAGGAWGDVVAARAGVAPLGLQPRRRTAALAALPDTGNGAAAQRWPMVMDVDGRWYAEPETGGILISPADETPVAPHDPSPEEIDVAIALERAGRGLGLRLRHVRRAWAGLRTFCPDDVPAVGPDPDVPGFIWLVGQGGSGIKTAPALAELAAAAILDGAPVPQALGPGRFR